MTTTLLLLASGMVAAFAAGAALAYVVARRAGVVDTVASDQWLAEIEGLRRTCEDQRAQLAGHATEAEVRQDELQRLQEAVASLEHDVTRYVKQYAVAKDTLKKEIRQKNSLRTELAAAQAEVEALRSRVLELQMGVDPAVSRRLPTRPVPG
jgi:chromosome segregation ATPase